MQNYRFYLDCSTNKEKRKYSIRKGIIPSFPYNCLAISTEIGIHITTGNYEGPCAVFYHQNSDLNWGSISPEYLRKCCTRISEKLAFELHPKLKEYLEYEPDISFEETEEYLNELAKLKKK